MKETQPGELMGHVELAPDVPATYCHVLLEGAPLGALCDDNGDFDIAGVPTGRWMLRVLTDRGARALPAKRMAVGSNPGMVTDMGNVVLSKPGAIGGHVRNVGSDQAIVAVPGLGAASAANTNGGFLLEGIPAGVHEIVLVTKAGTVSRQQIAVQAGRVAIAGDLDGALAAPATAQLVGVAKRSGIGKHGGITIQAVDTIDGTVVQTGTTDDSGRYTLGNVRHGTYVLRAIDGDSPIQPIIPGIVMRGAATLEPGPTLYLMPKGGDLDGDGVANDSDGDIDGDGVANAQDAFPYDPAESKDADGDGLGDLLDLKSKGGTTIDQQTPTPDTDGDGKLDFEDNCPKNVNADQKDTDADGVGDTCDNCPTAANPEQADTVGTGTGDACRFCKQNVDCGSGQICQFGQCVECLATSQCGDKVCDTAAGKCVPCDAAHLCSGTYHCSAESRCVECINKEDCGTGKTCVFNSCVPQCTTDSNCLTGQYCVGGACAGCRTTADCFGTQYCDNGVCRNQCLTTSDCTGGRSCDPATHTCVLPCNGTCLNGQTCQGGICRTICNLTQPCGSGLVCSADMLCVPECTQTSDCAAKPFTVCNAGTCVASGTCAHDADCPATQICSVALGASSGTCVVRPTTTNASGNYTCTATCDCRMGEICSAGVCVADPLGAPTRFVSSSRGTAAGDAKTPDTAVSSIAQVSTATKGTVVAIAAGDTLEIAAPLPITAGGVTVAGGYLVCAPNRWVRDDTQTSTVANTANNGKGVFTIQGTALAPLDGIELHSLTLTMADSQSVGAGASIRGVDAAYASHLTLRHIVARFTPVVPTGGRTIGGVYCSNCTDVVWDDISTPGITETTTSTMRFVELQYGSGTISGVKTGPVQAAELWGVRAVNLAGDLTVKDGQFEGCAWTGAISCNFVRVEESIAGQKVAITNNQLPFGAHASSGTVTAIAVKSVAAVNVTGNIIDGGPIVQATTASDQSGITILDTDGTVDRNTITLPRFTAPAAVHSVYGLYQGGPRGAVTWSNNKVSGGSAFNIILATVRDLTGGPAVFTKNDLSGGAVSNHGWGFYVLNCKGPSPTFIATDNTVRAAGRIAGASPELNAFHVDGSLARFERNKLYTGDGALIHNTINASTVELYDNYARNGITSGTSYALEVSTGSTLLVVGNTLDPGGAPAAGTSSAGIRSPANGTMTSASVFVSNLISAGNTLSPVPVSGWDFARLQPNAHNNYFWLPGGPLANASVYDLTGGSATAPPLNNNIVDRVQSYGCHSSTATTPDYHIVAGSPCVDKGATGTRPDGTAIDKDVDGLPRTLPASGGTPDIGCSELM